MMPRNKKIIPIFFVLVVIVLAAGAIWLYAQKNDGQQFKTQPKMSTKQTKSSDKSSGEALKSGSYQIYSQAAIKNSANRHLVLFFHAPWCPQCRALEADIKAQGVPNGVAIFKIDYDSNQDLRQKYGVTQQTTVILVDKNGNKIRSFLPYADPTLENALSGLNLR